VITSNAKGRSDELTVVIGTAASAGAWVGAVVGGIFLITFVNSSFARRRVWFFFSENVPLPCLHCAAGTRGRSRVAAKSKNGDKWFSPKIYDTPRSMVFSRLLDKLAALERE
jgi:hypothetical protein